VSFFPTTGLASFDAVAEPSNDILLSSLRKIAGELGFSVELESSI
jgi:hypothetical protein